MNVVSNTSPLTNLAWIGQLDILRQLYGELTIPEAVWQEVVVKGAGQPGAAEVREASWIKRQQVSNTSLIRALQQELDAGEAEAIALALELNADLLLMDERLGRQTADHLGLNFTGLIGVLIVAKQRGLVSEVKPLLDALRSQAGFRISHTLYARVLHDLKEA